MDNKEIIQNNLDKIRNKFENDGIILDIYYAKSGDYLALSKIQIPKDKRGEGIGSEVMKQIIEFADKNKKMIALSPSKDFGASFFFGSA